jgi:hypothetical protein
VEVEEVVNLLIQQLQECQEDQEVVLKEVELHQVVQVILLL